MIDIARPTEKVEIRYLIPDYMPNIPSMKVYLNLVYNTVFQGISSLCKSLFEN
jgi:hypothetical protein